MEKYYLVKNIKRIKQKLIQSKELGFFLFFCLLISLRMYLKPKEYDEKSKIRRN